MRRLLTDGRGQSVVEFAVILPILLLIVLGVVDFGRLIYRYQIAVNLAREGANLASRGTSLTDTVTALRGSSSPINLDTEGRVIVSEITNQSGTMKITGQTSSGGIAGTSRVGVGIGATANLPATNVPILQPNDVLHAAEVFIVFHPITPIGIWFGGSLPTRIYDVAYF